ncbi:hypothetical protein GCM10027051_27610 [Niabella terrae]
MLTKEQIQSLDQFCQKKGVRYYDLKMEMVDHLAAGIEERVAANSNVGFNTALQQVYASFGIAGFSKLVQQREEAARKACRKKEFRLFLDFFTFPKVAISLLLFFLLMAPVSIFKIQDAGAVYKIYCVFLFVFSILSVIFVSRKFKRPIQKLLTLKGTGTFTVFIGLFQVPNLYYNLAIKGFEIDINHALWFNPVMAGFCTLAVLFTLARYHAYRITYNHARYHYPMAFEK